MEFLREFGFGGCLADDMGVGKTAQVLAALESRRAEGHGPSLVVAPKSLMFNWRAEAQRFTPQLRVLEHTGLARDTALIARARSGPHHLRHAAARRRAAGGNGVRLRGAGRGAGRQELGHGIGQGGAPAARRASPGAQRHAGGEPPGRVVEPVRVPQSRACWARPRCCNMAGGLARNPGEDARAHSGAGAAAVHPAAHQAAGGARTAGEDRADHLLRTGRPRSGSSTTSCASTTARRCWRACSRRASANRRCTCWRRCCACARRPAIPGCSTSSAPTSPAPSWTC